MYAGAPLALGALRLQKPDLPRHYRLPAARVLAPLSFVLANFIVFWSGWVTVWKLMIVVLVGYALMGASAALKLNDRRPAMDWAAAGWLFPYLIGMTVISYFGGFGGGRGDLPLWWDLLVLTVFSVAIYYLAMARRLPAARVDEYVRDVYPTPE